MNILLKDIKEDKLLFDAICSIKKTHQKYKDKMKKMLSIHVDEAAVKDLLSRREDKLKKLAKLKDRLNSVRKEEKQDVKRLKKRRKAIQDSINNMKYRRLQKYGIVSLTPQLLGHIIDYVASEPKHLYNMACSSLIHQFSKEMDTVVTWTRQKIEGMMPSKHEKALRFINRSVNTQCTYLNMLCKVRFMIFYIFKEIHVECLQRAAAQNYHGNHLRAIHDVLRGRIKTHDSLIYSCTGIGRLSDIKWLAEYFKVSSSW